LINEDAAVKRLSKFGWLTIYAVFLLIFIGGVVRGTGAGMGCPDWPKCFGQWVPPTDVSELPANYQEVYKDHGYASMEFNVLRTWTEYLNRLSGVLIGFFIFLTVVFSFPYLKRDAAIFWLNLLAFLLVGLQGWIGAKVVDTNLAHWMVTIHMLLALVIVGILIYSITRSQQFVIESTAGNEKKSSLKIITITGLLLAVAQVVIGTQVREEVDLMQLTYQNSSRELWLGQSGAVFGWHKVFSLALVAANLWLMSSIYLQFSNTQLNKAANWLIMSLGAQLLGGILLEKLDIPPILQMFHLFIGSISIGIQLYIYILVFTKIRYNSGN